VYTRSRARVLSSAQGPCPERFCCRLSASDPARDVAERSALIHREILQLALLIAVAVAAFLVTRVVAANNRATSVRDAVGWYSRGQRQLGAGQVDEAIDSFRRATVRDSGSRRYALALARAQARHGDVDAARSTLIGLRESAPEDPDINLELARLSAQRADVA